MVINYKPGKNIPLADILSWKPLSQRINSLQACIEMQVNAVMRNFPVSDTTLNKIQKVTLED